MSTIILWYDRNKHIKHLSENKTPESILDSFLGYYVNNCAHHGDKNIHRLEFLDNDLLYTRKIFSNKHERIQTNKVFITSSKKSVLQLGTFKKYFPLKSTHSLDHTITDKNYWRIAILNNTRIDTIYTHNNLLVFRIRYIDEKN